MSSDPLLDQLKPHVSNRLPTQLPEFVAFIVGTNPSVGARSPKLWNAAFAACKIDGVMYPLDVDSANLLTVLRILERDPRVLGVAIAAPHKSSAAQLFIDRLSPTSEVSGSVNLLHRAEDMKFDGENTDGLAAVMSLNEVVSELESSKYLILGCGATGRSVISGLLQYTNRSNIHVVFRDESNVGWIIRAGVTYSLWSDLSSALSDANILINCTSVGWGDQVDDSPLSKFQLTSLSNKTVIFDVIYQPATTKLIESASELGLQTLNGLQMNLLQAAIAVNKTLRTSNMNTIVQAMRLGQENL
jgi:shikimate dehydrogenase